MIQTSSKRLSKIKKKLKKNEPSNYHFLINSLERESNKQNYASNQINMNNTSLKNSIQLVKPSMIHSFDNCKLQQNQSGDYNKIKLNNNNIPFFQNVKFLKNSRLQEQKPENKFILSKQRYQKNIELSQNAKSKQINQSGRNQRTNKFTQNLNDTIEQKFEAYVQFVNEIFQEIIKSNNLNISNQISRKKCLLQTLSKQFLRQMRKNYDTHSFKVLNKSIQVSNFCSIPSKVMSRQLQKSITLKQKPQQNGYKKIIDELSYQNTKLTQLISQHQRKNIKMFIQMNQNQSKQIQNCKRYLSSLYDKYKILQKSLLKENGKLKKACEEKAQLEKKVTQLQKKNQDLSTQLQKTKQELRQNANQTISKLSFDQESYNTMFNFNLNQFKENKERLKHGKSKLSVNQNLRMDRSFITRRDKASSCLSTELNGHIKRKDEDLMSCSTITKTKNMKKKKQKIQIGINLKENFTKDQQNNLINMRKQITSLKQKLNEQVVLKLALQKQVNNLQASVKKRNQKLQKMQAIINEQISEIQKLMIANSKLSQQVKTLQEGKQNQILSKNQIAQRLHQVRLNNFKAENNSSFLTQKKETQYRIIAMQAAMLQNLLNFS